jgi:hypothetical protein
MLIGIPHAALAAGSRGTLVLSACCHRDIGSQHLICLKIGIRNQVSTSKMRRNSGRSSRSEPARPVVLRNTCTSVLENCLNRLVMATQPTVSNSDVVRHGMRALRRLSGWITAKPKADQVKRGRVSKFVRISGLPASHQPLSSKVGRFRRGSAQWQFLGS